MLDTIVIAVYFAVMLGAAWWGFRRAKTADDYLVAGQGSATPMFIGTLSAVVLGGASTVGTVSLGYEHGISGAALVFMIGLGLIGLGVLLSRRLVKAGVYTVPELMAKRYGVSPAIVSAAIMSAYALMIAVTSTIASGTVFNSLLNVSTTAAVLIAGGVVVLYCVTGGMWSLTLTDIIQFGIMTVGHLRPAAAVRDQRGGRPERDARHAARRATSSRRRSAGTRSSPTSCCSSSA